MDLKGREILKTGTWNGETFIEADLDDIVNNFNKLKEVHKVPLKFGHDADHVKDGQPAIGWVSRVFRKGQILYADFSDLPKIVFEAIKKKLYRAVSVEVLFGVDSEGKRYNHVLDAVALLGADQPAVSGLADLNALLATRTEFTGGHRLAFNVIAGNKAGGPKRGNDPPNKKEGEMDKKETEDMINAALKPLNDANLKLTADLDTANKLVAKYAKDKEEADHDTEQKAIKLSRANVTEILDQAVRQKTLTPAVRETYSSQIGLDDDERVVNIKLDEVKAMFSVTKIDDKQQGLEKDKKDEDDLDNPESALMSLTRKNMADNGESDFAEMFKLTCSAHPKLHKAYLDSNGEK